jgi:hypothetical protein
MIGAFGRKVSIMKLNFTGLSLFFIISSLLLVAVFLDLKRSTPFFGQNQDEEIKLAIRLDDFGERVFDKYMNKIREEKREVASSLTKEDPHYPEDLAVEKPSEVKNEIEEVPPTPLEEKGENALELDLYEAYNLVKWNKSLTGAMVHGSVTFLGDSIENLIVSLSPENSSSLQLRFEFAELNDGGQFLVDLENDSISGLFSKGEEGTFQLRFATGPLMGTVLYFRSRVNNEDLWVSEGSYEEKLIQEGLEIKQSEEEELRQESYEDEMMNRDIYGHESELNHDIKSELILEDQWAEERETGVEYFVSDHVSEVTEEEMNSFAEDSGYQF